MASLEQPPADPAALAETIAEAPPNAAPPIPQGGLEVVSIAKSYDKRAVLTDISLTVGKGEVLGLLGPNGAGKTTTFYMTVGRTAPDSGRVIFDGEDVTDDPMYVRARKGIGYLPQEASIFRGLTVEQNIQAILETTNLAAGALIVIETVTSSSGMREPAQMIWWRSSVFGWSSMSTSTYRSCSCRPRRRATLSCVCG